MDSGLFILYFRFNPVLLHFLAQTLAALAIGGSFWPVSLLHTPIIGGVLRGFVLFLTALP